MNAPASLAKTPSRRRMIVATVLVTGATLFLFALIFASPIAVFFATGGAAQFAQPPATVSTVIARYEEWTPQTEVVGSFTAGNGADLAVEIAGVVEAIYFESGADVTAGQPLLKLRDDEEAARLRTLEAAAELAAATYARHERLWEIQGISHADVEAGAANLKAARAAVEQQAAMLAKRTVRAPFAGRVGIRHVNVGQYLNAGTPVVTLQALDPINLDFTVPQQMLQRLTVGQEIAVKVDAFPYATFTGRIIAIDPKVNPTTRNVAVRATLANPNRVLLPGMYATAEVGTGAAERHITLPQTAVGYNPYGNTVYLVRETTENGEPRLVAQQTIVTTGAARGDQVTILSGLNEGDVVVSAGQMKLQNGAAIAIDNTIQPANDPNPRPVER